MKYLTVITILVLLCVFCLILFNSIRVKKSVNSFTRPLIGVSSMLSLSLSDLMFLSLSDEDRSTSIKDFYDWKHKSLSFSVKALLSFILGNTGVIIKKLYDIKISEQIITLPITGILLIILILILIVIEYNLITKLRRVPQEYIDAMRLYTLFKI